MDPASFFAQTESACELRGITSQKRKFHFAVSKVNYMIAQEVREVIISPTAVNKLCHFQRQSNCEDFY